MDERAIKNGSAEILIWKNSYLRRKTSALKTKLKIKSGNRNADHKWQMYQWMENSEN